MQTLKKQIGLRTVVSTGAGLALASLSYVSLVELSGHTSGSSSWIPLLVAGFICFLASLCFAELGSMFPTAAGIKLFIEKAFGESTALILASLYILTTLSLVGAEMYILGSVLEYSFPRIPLPAWAFAFLTCTCLINMRGIKVSGIFQDIISYLMFILLIALSWCALIRFQFPLQHFLNPIADKSPMDFFEAVGLGVFLYLGFEWVTPLAEEVKEYKYIQKGMFLSIILLFVSYASFVTAMTSIGNKAELNALIASGKPIPHILFAVNALGTPGLIVMIFMSVVASLTTFNAGLLTASRFLYALARDHTAPSWLSKVHEKYMTPYIAILALYIGCISVSLFVIYTGIVKPFIYMGAFAECLIYVAIAASMIRLRKTMPEVERPFRVTTMLIPYFVIFLFTVLGVGLLIGNRTAALTMFSVLVVVVLYVKFAVPYFKNQFAKVSMSRTPRRRRPVTIE